jgi:tetratricopeptide (TPR) repeat protein
LRKEREMHDILKTWRISPKSALTIVFLAFFISECIWPITPSAFIGIKEGDRPKTVILDDLKGVSVDVSRFFGKNPVVLVFWKLTANKLFLDYSLDELLFLEDFYQKYHDKEGLEIFGIYTPESDKDISSDEIARVKNFIKINKINFPILIDKGFKLFKENGVIALPSTIMIDKTGIIKFTYPSFPIAARPHVAEKIDDLVGITRVASKKESVKLEKPELQSNRFYHYALHMYKRGLLQHSLSPLDKSLELDPKNAWAYNLMGIILWKKGVSDRSMEKFRDAITLDKKNIAVSLNYAVLLIEQENYKEAESILKNLPTAEKDLKIRAHYLLGLVYKSTNRYDKAIREIELANSLSKEEAPVIDESATPSYSIRVSILHELSELYDKEGSKDKALDVLHEALHEAVIIGGKKDTKQHLKKIEDLMIYE